MDPVSSNLGRAAGVDISVQAGWLRKWMDEC